jgi:hypothetical protein
MRVSRFQTDWGSKVCTRSSDVKRTTFSPPAAPAARTRIVATTNA